MFSTGGRRGRGGGVPRGSRKRGARPNSEWEAKGSQNVSLVASWSGRSKRSVRRTRAPTARSRPRGPFSIRCLFFSFLLGCIPSPRGCLMRSLCFSGLSHLSLAGRLRLLSCSAFPFSVCSHGPLSLGSFSFIFVGGFESKAHMHRHTHTKIHEWVSFKSNQLTPPLYSPHLRAPDLPCSFQYAHRPPFDPWLYHTHQTSPAPCPPLSFPEKVALAFVII